jgi:ABC-type branched-subunit amino acid transport system substrate-binding protein
VTTNADPLTSAPIPITRSSRGRRRHSWAFATTGIAITMFAAACGGGSSGGATANPSSGTTSTATAAASGVSAQGITASSITIGIDAINSGPIAPAFVGADQYFKAWLSAVNASGGIDGRQVKTIELDNAGNPAQTLSNFKTLWEQDHVAAIVEDGIAIPDAYATSKGIPVFTNGAAPEDYASANTSVFPIVGTIEAWGAESANFFVNVEHHKPTSVGVLTDGTDPEFNTYIKSYWQKLGVTKVDLEPGGPPGASCSSDILKWKSLNVDYIDLQSTTETPACLQAEAQLGWKPALGQGGIGASSTRTAEQVGAPFNGLVTGAPVVNYTGAPFSTSPTPALKTYVANVKKYASGADTTPIYLNSPIDSGYYSIAQVVDQAFTGALKQSGLTTAGLVKYIQGMTNIQTTTLAPVKSLAPTCKTGSNGTVWGFWHYDPATKAVTYKLTSGKSWISTDFIGGPCYLTQFTSKLFPKG